MFKGLEASSSGAMSSWIPQQKPHECHVLSGLDLQMSLSPPGFVQSSLTGIRRCTEAEESEGEGVDGCTGNTGHW